MPKQIPTDIGLALKAMREAEQRRTQIIKDREEQIRYYKTVVAKHKRIIATHQARIGESQRVIDAHVNAIEECRGEIASVKDPANFQEQEIDLSSSSESEFESGSESESVSDSSSTSVQSLLFLPAKHNTVGVSKAPHRAQKPEQKRKGSECDEFDRIEAEAKEKARLLIAARKAGNR